MNAIVSSDRLATRKITDRFSVTSEDMEGFAALSGDRSPVHGAADFARRLGLEGRVVYEGLIVARLSRLVGGNLWGALRIDFHYPLYVGEPAVMTLVADETMSTSGIARFDFRLEAGGRLIADGAIDTLSRPA
jgi:3-oxoacyl-[acyl-carrier protein] reductase